MTGRKEEIMDFKTTACLLSCSYSVKTPKLCRLLSTHQDAPLNVSVLLEPFFAKIVHKKNFKLTCSFQRYQARQKSKQENDFINFWKYWGEKKLLTKIKMCPWSVLKLQLRMEIYLWNTEAFFPLNLPYLVFSKLNLNSINSNKELLWHKGVLSTQSTKNKQTKKQHRKIHIYVDKL